MQTPNISLSTHTSLADETDHITDLEVYNIVHADGDDNFFAVVGGAGSDVITKLLEIWHFHTTDPDGLYCVWQSVLVDTRFASGAGPLRNRMKADQLLFAAILCYSAARGPIMGRTVGESCIPLNRYKSCSDLRRIPTTGTEAYDRALAMAATIVKRYLLDDPNDQLEIDAIMDKDIYSSLHNNYQYSLRTFGIVSPNSTTVGNPIDLRGVILPMFMALDSVLPDSIWRSICLHQNVLAPDEEITEHVENNVRIHHDYWT